MFTPTVNPVIRGLLNGFALGDMLRRNAQQQEEFEARKQDRERARVLQDVEFQQRMAQIARPVRNGVVSDDVEIPDATGLSGGPRTGTISRPADKTRLVRYKTASGEQMEHELLPYAEQVRNAINAMAAQKRLEAQIAAEGAGQAELAKGRAQAQVRSETDPREPVNPWLRQVLDLPENFELRGSETAKLMPTVARELLTNRRAAADRSSREQIAAQNNAERMKREQLRQQGMNVRSAADRNATLTAAQQARADQYRINQEATDAQIESEAANLEAMANKIDLGLKVGRVYTIEEDEKGVRRLRELRDRSGDPVKPETKWFSSEPTEEEVQRAKLLSDQLREQARIKRLQMKRRVLSRDPDARGVSVQGAEAWETYQKSRSAADRKPAAASKWEAYKKKAGRQ